MFGIILENWSYSYSKQKEQKQIEYLNERHEKFMKEIGPSLELADRINREAAKSEFEKNRFL